MANPWFKLYGVEMLSDPKYQRLNAGERSCWITLLCLGSMDNGIVKFCEEQYLISHSGIDPMEVNKYHGILIKFEVLGMINKCRDEIGIEYIQIKNWGKRQEVYSESKERVQRWREKQKESKDVTLVTLPSNARIEENRIDKKRIEENTNTIQFFLFNKNTQTQESNRFFSSRKEASQYVAKNYKGESFFELEIQQK